MEVIMSSPIQESSGMENNRGDGAGKLSRTQRRRRMKKRSKMKLLEERMHASLESSMHASLESSNKREDTGNPESQLEVPHQNIDIITQSPVQDSLNTGLGTTATVDQKRTMSSTAATSDGRSSISQREGCMEIAKGEKGSSRTTAVDVRTGSNREEYMEIANDKRGSSRNATLDAKRLSKREERTEIANGEMGCSSAIATLDTKSTVSKREQHVKIANDETGSSGTAIIDANTGSKREEYMGTANGETVSGRTATPDSETVSKGEEHTKVSSGEMSLGTTTTLNVKSTVQKKRKQKSRRKPTLGEILNPRYLENMETANVATGSGTAVTTNTASKKRKKRNKKPASGDVLNTCERTQETVIAKKGSSTTKVLEAMITESKTKDHPEIVNGAKCPRTTVALDAKSTMLKTAGCTEIANGEMGSCRTTTIDENSGSSGMATLDAKTVSKREEYTKIVNGETGLRTTATGDAKSVALEGEWHMKIDGGETASSRTATVDAKTGAREEHMEILESKREVYTKVANGEKGSEISETHNDKNRVSESDRYMKITNGETNSIRTRSIDAKTVLKVEECTTLGNGETSASTITALLEAPLNGKRLKRKRPTIGDILNPRYLEYLDIANTNRALSRKIKRQKLKKKRALGLNTYESTEDKAISKITHVATAISGKKLLIFDVNGLLADIVSPRPKDCKADKHLPKRAIFKRPFLDDFLCFCFERFNVGIWSSRTKKILDPVVDYLLGDSKKKLLFLWDASSCTNSGMRTLEDKHKCIVFKNLKKIWEKNGPGDSWVKGFFNESNTLLLDDSPYKALLNPKHTGIFPVSYSYKNVNDDFLGPNGDLRIYLEGVAATDNVKTYVEEHPFGQGAIDETSPHWAFYSRVLKGQGK